MYLERSTKISIARFLIPGILIGMVLVAVSVLAYHESGDARFCGSCHSMKTVHAAWKKSNHYQFTCTECHLPDTHITGKVAYKTRAGINDLVHETVRDYQAGIGLSARGRGIVTGNCRRCHASTIAATLMSRDGTNCLKCHRYMVHGRGTDEGGVKIEKH